MQRALGWPGLTMPSLQARLSYAAVAVDARWQTWRQSLAERTAAALLPAILWAVPKSKVPRWRKRRRNLRNYTLSNRTDIVPCVLCGTPTLANHLCQKCFEGLQREERRILGIAESPEAEKHAIRKRRFAWGKENLAALRADLESFESAPPSRESHRETSG